VADGQAEVRITVDELSYKEKLRRVGTNDTPEVALFRGALAFNASAQPQAREYFSRAGPVLSGPLLALVGGGEPAEPKPEPAAADAAETALVELLRRAGIAVGPYDEAAWLKAVAEARLDAVTASTVLEALIAYLEQYRESPFVARARPVLAALERKCQRASDGEDGGPVSPEAAGTLDDEGVANLLIAKNPGLTAAEIECTRKEGGIDALTVRSGAFKDFSPVASLPKLRSFTYEAVNAGTVVDLRPLKFAASLAEIVLKRCELPDPAVLGDLTASRLVLEGCGIRDLGGLAKSAVTDLDLSDTDVKDLTPLRSLKLDSLTLNNTRITALNLPSGMPLRRLSANGTMIRDLTGLRTLPLEEVRLAGIKAFDFQPLRGIKLRYLDLSDTQFRDPTLCQGMPLVGLYLRRTNISDLSRFRGTDLEELDISYTSVKDLSPLRGLRLRWLDISGLRLGSESPAVLAEMPLRWLSAADTTLSDLSLLRGKPLRFLNVANTPVRDLTALGGMPLEHLDIGETSVADLAPLKGMPLRVLRCRGSRVTDPLQVVELPVEELTFNIEPGDYAMLAKKMPRLRQLNGEPVPTRDRRP
jgi:Leucine-rich repeat (LRR) protein